MNCIEDEWIQRYIDREVTPVEMAGIEDHLATCKRCAERVDRQGKRAAAIKKAIVLLADEPVVIPRMDVPPLRSHNRVTAGRRIFYLVSAACILLFILFIPGKKQAEISEELINMHNIDREYDANKTLLQQPLVIFITEPDGNVIPYIIK